MTTTKSQEEARSIRTTRVRSTMALAALVSVCAVAGCGEDAPAPPSTNPSAPPDPSCAAPGGDPSSSMGGGCPDAPEAAQGGTGSLGGGGTGAGGLGGAGGDGGAGGSWVPEEVVNDSCLHSTAYDRTDEADVELLIPDFNYCVRVSAGASLTFALNEPTEHRYLGGTYDDDTQTASPDPSSPIEDSCPTPPHTCSPSVTNPPIQITEVGAYPWYDHHHPATIKGVVWVE